MMMIGFLRKYWPYAAGVVAVILAVLLLKPSPKPEETPTPQPVVEVVDSSHVETIDTSHASMVVVSYSKSKVKVVIPEGTVVGPGGITVENSVVNNDSANGSTERKTETKVEEHTAIAITPEVKPPVVVQPVKRFDIGVGMTAYPTITPTAILLYRVFWRAGVGVGVTLPINGYAAIAADVGSMLGFHVIVGGGYSLNKKIVALAAVTL
jgi:hypothetical protein